MAVGLGAAEGVIGGMVVATGGEDEAASDAVADVAPEVWPGPAAGAVDDEQAEAANAATTRVQAVARRTGTPW